MAKASVARERLSGICSSSSLLMAAALKGVSRLRPSGTGTLFCALECTYGTDNYSIRDSML